MDNDLKEWLPHFLSEFHQAQLKPLGFKKERRTFSRDMGSYWERFNFQGDEFNGIAGWKFFLNVGVEFKDLVPRVYWSGFPHTHWTTRTETLVPGSPKEWEYGADAETFVLAYTLRQVMMRASQAIADDIDRIRERVLAETRRGLP